MGQELFFVSLFKRGMGWVPALVIEAAMEGDFEQSLTFVQAALESPEVETKELVPEAAAGSPEQTVTAKELLEHLQQAIQTWPRQEREVFELYFVEGFEPDDIAMITGKPPQKIRAVITPLQDRLRQELLSASMTNGAGIHSTC
jgi:RNA polymerase sigma factor (sigma-70 family)